MHCSKIWNYDDRFYNPFQQPPTQVGNIFGQKFAENSTNNPFWALQLKPSHHHQAEGPQYEVILTFHWLFGFNTEKKEENVSQLLFLYVYVFRVEEKSTEKSLKSTEKKYEVDFGIGNVFWVFHLYARLRLWVEVEKFKQLSDICQRSQYRVVFRIHAERFSSIDKKSQHAHVKNWQTFFRTIMLLNSVNYFPMKDWEIFFLAVGFRASCCCMNFELLHWHSFAHPQQQQQLSLANSTN